MQIISQKKLFTIRDWSGNYPFEANKHQSAVALSGHPVITWGSFDEAEEYLTEYLGDNYDELRGEYFIEEIVIK